ncbi:hypothetical protein BGZ82_008246 [Podila clonocystis]|nr:hypothetical protein BGZ82_008246 [Podila clonocystis]
MLRVPIEFIDVPSIIQASLQNGLDNHSDNQLNFGEYFHRRDNNRQPPARAASRTARLGLPTKIQYSAWIEGMIHLGTPPQQFTVQISTIEPYSYVLSKACHVWGCSGRRRYNATASSTYKENGTYFDLDGMVKGRISNDVLRIGYKQDSGGDDSNVLVIPDQDFGEATFDASCWLPILGCGGFLGLGFSSDNEDEAAATGVPPVRNWANQQKSREDAVVGMYISPDMVRPGQITFGGLDRAHYIGELHWNALAKQGTWSAHLNRIVARTRSGGVERSVPMIDTPTLFSTTTNLLASLSLEQAKVVNEELLGGTEIDDPQSRGYYVLPCDSLDTLPSISFVIGSEYYTFKASEYVQIYETADGVKTCSSLINGSEEQQRLGLAFMRKYYVGLDIGQDRIG